MKKKIQRSVALLFAAVLSTVAVIAQPGSHKSDNNDRRYDNRGGDYRWDGRNDHDGNFKNDSRGYNKYDYAYSKVKHRPKGPRIVQSRRPSPMHVWIPGDWVYSHGDYRYQPGFWMIPNRGRQFVEGHWEHTRHGWYWVPGYWTVARGRW